MKWKLNKKVPMHYAETPAGDYKVIPVEGHWEIKLGNKMLGWADTAEAAIKKAEQHSQKSASACTLVKLFDLINEHDESRPLGGSLGEGNAYISMYGALVKGEKKVSDLHVGERTRKRYSLSGGKPTVYAIERIQ